MTKCIISQKGVGQMTSLTGVLDITVVSTMVVATASRNGKDFLNH